MKTLLGIFVVLVTLTWSCASTKPAEEPAAAPEAVAADDGAAVEEVQAAPEAQAEAPPPSDD